MREIGEMMSLMRDEGLMREMRELEMMKKKKEASEVLREHDRSRIKDGAQ